MQNELRFSKIVNRELKKAEMLLYGELGEDEGEINGHYFARELNWLAREYDEITIRINSYGGSVQHGLSVVSEMMNSAAVIIARVDGIAASMAAVILAAADRVEINDYGKIMVHSPFYVDDDGKAVKNLSAKDRKGLTMIKDTLKNLLAKRGIAAADINKYMQTDSWFTAEEAKDALLVDEVKQTGRKKELAALDPKKLVAKLNSEISNSNSNNMKKVLAKLGLSDDATEDQALEAINKLTPAQQPDNKVLVDKFIAVGKKIGRINDKNEAKVRALAETDMELFVDFCGIDNVEKPEDNGVRLSDVVAELKKNSKQSVNEGGKDWDWYQKNDPQALAEMEVAKPEEFKKLQAAYNAQFE